MCAGSVCEFLYTLIDQFQIYWLHSVDINEINNLVYVNFVRIIMIIRTPI